MAYKTISGHYGTTFSLEHNNRNFTPKNVDPSRSKNNDYLIAAGQYVPDSFPKISDMKTLWGTYKTINEMYWRGYKLKNDKLKKRVSEIMSLQRKMEWLANRVEENPILGFMKILLFPLFFPVEIAISCHLQDQLDQVNTEQFFLQCDKEIFHNQKDSLRDALRKQDRKKGTKLLQEMDTMVSIASNLADLYAPSQIRFATIDEIYSKVFEPGFREFQTKQRKCRRYNGTYLQQIRQRQEHQARSKAKNEKNRAISEAIEIVFSIGDMDNTGYRNAPLDATKSEQLLNKFNRHLLSLPNVCVITTAEINTPGWKPPFRHGLILLNLTAHFDESTPGIHMTAIPYSRGCRRGPEAQPSLGRAFTGMGYPSTWRDVVDENGEPVPKLDKNNEIIYNEDGTIRIQKVSEKQGIVDWIEEQKCWLQREMETQYEWKRQYKGKHSRGNLSTPDYRIERALERYKEQEELFRQAINNYSNRIIQINRTLEQTIDETLEKHPDFRIIVNYLQICPDERFNQLLDEAMQSYRHLSVNEYNNLHKSLSQLIANAERKAAQGNQSGAVNELDIDDKYLPASRHICTRLP